MIIQKNHHYIQPYLNAWGQISDVRTNIGQTSELERRIPTTVSSITFKDIEDKDDNLGPKKKKTSTLRYVRDTITSVKMKILYDYRCQVCNYRVEADSTYYAEVHHLWPLSEGGPDTVSNMLVLCPNHHVEFDYAVIGIDPSDGATIIDRKRRAFGKLTIKEGHRLKIENVQYQLRRMKL